MSALHRIAAAKKTKLLQVSWAYVLQLCCRFASCRTKGSHPTVWLTDVEHHHMGVHQPLHFAAWLQNGYTLATLQK